MFTYFKKWIVPYETSQLYQDFIQGVSTVRDFLLLVPEQAFMEMENIRLQHRLVRVNKKLSDAYRKLGEQGLNELGYEEKHLEAFYQQIEDVLKDQKQVLSEIEQASSEEEIKEEIKNAE